MHRIIRQQREKSIRKHREELIGNKKQEEIAVLREKIHVRMPRNKP